MVSRDALGKWAAVLAHFVPNIPIKFLPLPAGHPSLHYVHYAMPVEGEFAIQAVASLGISPSFAEMILASTQAYFYGQSDSVLLQNSSTWRGFAWVMQFVVQCHLTVIERFMVKEEALLTDEEFLRCLPLQVFRYFWDIQEVFDTGIWKETLRQFWEDPNSSPFQFKESFPSFEHIYHSR